MCRSSSSSSSVNTSLEQIIMAFMSLHSGWLWQSTYRHGASARRTLGSSGCGFNGWPLLYCFLRKFGFICLSAFDQFQVISLCADLVTVLTDSWVTCYRQDRILSSRNSKFQAWWHFFLSLICCKLNDCNQICAIVISRKNWIGRHLLGRSAFEEFVEQIHNISTIREILAEVLVL